MSAYWKVQTLYIVCTISFNIYVCMVLCLCVYVGSNDSLDFSARKYIKTTLIPLALLFSLHFTFSPLKSYQIYSLFKQPSLRTSLMVQWTEIPCQCRGHSFHHWAGKIPHTLGELSSCIITIELALQSLWAATTEAHVPRAHALQQEKPPQWEAHVSQLESRPHSPRSHMLQLRVHTPKLKILCAASETQCNQINKYFWKSFFKH